MKIDFTLEELKLITDALVHFSISLNANKLQNVHIEKLIEKINDSPIESARVN